MIQFPAYPEIILSVFSLKRYKGIYFPKYYGGGRGMAAGKKLIMNVQGKGEKKKMASKKGLNASKMHIFFSADISTLEKNGSQRWGEGGGWTGRNAQWIIIPYNGIFSHFYDKMILKDPTASYSWGTWRTATALCPATERRYPGSCSMFTSCLMFTSFSSESTNFKLIHRKPLYVPKSSISMFFNFILGLFFIVQILYPLKFSITLTSHNLKTLSFTFLRWWITIAKKIYK